MHYVIAWVVSSFMLIRKPPTGSLEKGQGWPAHTLALHTGLLFILSEVNNDILAIYICIYHPEQVSLSGQSSRINFAQWTIILSKIRSVDNHPE